MNQQNKPVTQVLIDYKEMQNLDQLSTMLETIAKKLRENGKFTFIQGEKEVAVRLS